MKAGRVVDPIQRALAEAKRRTAEQAARPKKPTGARTTRPPSFGDYAGDVAKSVPTALLGTAEATLGGLGDLREGRWGLSQLINDYFKDKSGLDMGADLDRAKQLSATSAPTSDDITNWTNRKISDMSPEARQLMQKWFRHTPQTPFGQAAGLATELLLDPTDLLPVGPAIKMARKVF